MRIRLLIWSFIAVAGIASLALDARAARPATGVGETSVRVLVMRDAATSDSVGDVRSVVLPRAALALEMERLRDAPGNAVVEIDRERASAATATPTDPEFAAQWNLPAISWPVDAIDRPAGRIAFVDSGFDLALPDLRSAGASRFVGTWNAAAGTSDVTDQQGHGTAVAGLAGATADGTFGNVGVAPRAQLLGIRASDSSGRILISTVISAIQWAVEHDADVINLSLGSADPSEAEHLAIQQAVAAGVVVVASSGNRGCSGIDGGREYPAAYAEVLAVGAVDQTNASPCFSSYGDYVDVVAPGVDVPVMLPGGSTGVAEGTSFASPQVTGAVALLAARHPSATPAMLTGAIRDTATDISAPGFDTHTGYGLLNVSAALEWEPPVVPVEPDPPVEEPTEPSPKGGTEERVATAPQRALAIPADRFEPNGSVFVAARARAYFDIRARIRNIAASISRAGDPVDIYRVRLSRARPVLSVTLTLPSAARAQVGLDVLRRSGNSLVRACVARGARSLRCRAGADGELWVRLVARRGASSYRLRLNSCVSARRCPPA